jgi:hypothetical protein
MKIRTYVPFCLLTMLVAAGVVWSAGPAESPSPMVSTSIPAMKSDGPPLSLANTPPDVHINTPLIFTLTQEGITYSIPVLEKAQDVVAFYNYYSASSHTGYEVAYESKVFLYRNTIDNSLHLIFTHNIDYPPPTGDGRVDFDLSGIPPGAYVSQSDDPSHAWDPPRTQEFSLAYPAMEGHWYYTDNTDGGVLSGLPLNVAWCITIDPLYFDNINRWIYHFGSGDPIELDMNKPVTICFTPPSDPEEVSIDEGGQVSFSGFFDDPDAYDTHDALWEFGDSEDSVGIFFPGYGYTHHDMDPVVHPYGDNGDLTAWLTVDDDKGGTGSADVSVTVFNVPPVVDAGSDLTIEQGETVNLSASFTDPGWLDTHAGIIDWGDLDVEPGIVSEENDPPKATGTVTGEHYYSDCDLFTVFVTVTDDDGGAGVDNVHINVVDATAPEIICPPDTVLEAGEVCEATYTGPPASATDNCDPDPEILSTPALPATFTGLGTYTIIWVATDESGNLDSCFQTIEVIDLTPPEITCPPDTTLEAGSDCEAVYAGPPATALDNCDPDPEVESDPLLPASFSGVGNHEIEYTATDASGNSSVCVQTVTIIDVTAPLITCPPDIVLEADENCEVIYTGPPATATDNCDPDPDITSDPPLPVTFSGVGDHYIEYTATDAAGNISTCVQTITIIDVSPPTITCPPDKVMEADGSCEVIYSGPSATATDNCDGSPVITSDPPLPVTFSGVGDHKIEYIATDASGNSSSCVQIITIIDVTPPLIVCPPDVALEPEGFDCSVTYSGPPATATDNCDGSPVVTSDPPLPATFAKIGDHLIVFEAMDFSGNASVCTMTVTVLPTSLCLKDEAIELLLGLKPTGDDHLDKEIDKIAWHIEKSLDPELWLDVKHLDCQHGQKVFNEEETAVVLLRENMNKKGFPPGLVDDFVAAITMLLDADDILAKTQLDDAIALGGEEKFIEKAKSELALAWEKREANDYIHAIDHYRKAWDAACKALSNPHGEGAQVGSQSGALLEFRMSEGKPNPFRGTATLDYQIPSAASVTVRVYDLSGRLVRTILDCDQDAGIYSVHWDGTNTAGGRVLPGIYFVRLAAGDFVSSRKVVLLE